MVESNLRTFVTFYSPGTLFCESSTRRVESRDVKAACDLAKTIVERYDAVPFGFRFHDAVVHEGLDDGRGGTFSTTGKPLDESGYYFLGGEVRSLAEVEAAANPDEKILIWNMRFNDWSKVVTVRNRYRITQPFEPGDVVVDPETGEVREVA